MTTDQFDTAIKHINNLPNVRRVTVSGDGSLVEVFARVYYDRSGDLRHCSEVLFGDIVARMKRNGFIRKDIVVIDDDACDFDATEVWIFSR